MSGGEMATFLTEVSNQRCALVLPFSLLFLSLSRTVCRPARARRRVGLFRSFVSGA